MKAWGDHVLAGLRPKVRAIYQAGHFVAVEDGTGVLALPNPAHLVHAEPLRGEVAEALSNHLGCRVGLRLVPESAVAPGAVQPGASAAGPPSPRGPATPADEDEDEEPPELPDEGEPADGGGVGVPGITSAEDRLLRAFPGAEEVGP